MYSLYVYCLAHNLVTEHSSPVNAPFVPWEFFHFFVPFVELYLAEKVEKEEAMMMNKREAQHTNSCEWKGGLSKVP